MRWLPFALALLLLSTAEAGRWRQGVCSWQPGRPRVAVREGLAKRGDVLEIRRGKRSIRRTTCCTVRLPKGRSLDVDRKGFMALGVLPSRGLTTVRWRVEPRRR